MSKKRKIGPIAPRRGAFSPALDELERVLGVHFNDRVLLLTALTHSSYAQETHNESAENYERLEFLGDGVLDLIVKHHLYRLVPKREGRLELLRTALVGNWALGRVAEELGLHRFVRTGISQRRALETTELVHARRYILACVTEALIGAIFIDRGYAVAELFVHQHIMPRLDTVIEKDIRHPVSLLNELVQSRYGEQPRYKIERKESSAHYRRQVATVFIGDKKIAEAEGATRTEAKVSAAKAALINSFDREVEDD